VFVELDVFCGGDFLIDLPQQWFKNVVNPERFSCCKHAKILAVAVAFPADVTFPCFPCIGLQPTNIVECLIVQTQRDRSPVIAVKRLLYVAMTRARDLLIVARPTKKPSGEWIDCLNAPWLLPESSADALAVPDGDSIEAICWNLDAEGETETVPLADMPGVHGFVAAEARQARLPLVFNPSSASLREARIIEQVTIGSRLALMPGADITALGTAIHACIALSMVNQSQTIAKDDAERLLLAYGQDGKISVDGLLNQIGTFCQWLGTRWPQHTAYPEYPVQSVLANGQVSMLARNYPACAGTTPQAERV
jgi:hypothetical protein